MNTETGRINGDVQVTEDWILHGTVVGTVTVVEGGYLELHGMVIRDLVIEPGGMATLYGTVAGSVYNRGGELEVYGVVNGALQGDTGATFVDPNAVVSGLSAS